MDYQIARNGQPLGAATEAQLHAGLGNGTYHSTDLVWTEGMPDWKNAAEVFGSPAPATSVSPVTRVAATPLPRPASHVQSGVYGVTSGLATTSLFLGIFSIVPCSVFTGLPAIITGHVARSKIKNSGGALRGEGKALAGLIMGYLSIVFSIFYIAIAASMAIPVFNKIQQKGLQTKAMSNARQIIVACRIYASDNNGKYPSNLDVLVDEGIIADRSILACPIRIPGEDPGFEYLGAKLNDSDPGELIVLVSRWHDARGQHIVGHNNSSVVIEVPDPGNIRQ